MITADRLQKKYNLRIQGNPFSSKTIVFAHGFGSDQTAWRFVTEGFKDDYKIILYDNIGGGQSDPDAYSPLKYHSLEIYAADLLEIAETLELKDAILVAHSVSSMIGLFACLKNPDLFSKIVFVGASPRYLNDEGYEGGFGETDLEVLFQSMKSNYYAWASGFSAVVMRNTEKPELGNEFAGTLSRLQPDIALSVAKVIFNSDCRAELSKLKTEVLIVQSKDDAAVPDSVADFLHNELPNSRLVRINAEGHFAHLSAPLEVIECINSFL